MMSVFIHRFYQKYYIIHVGELDARCGLFPYSFIKDLDFKQKKVWHDNNMTSSVKHVGGSVMACACVAANGNGLAGVY